ncbi:hypothetical protein H2201_008310 [Coniosporium apollinis]|uniref:Acyl-CoA thioesterase II n=1 Tax=Coniosporium apollinis TaxID=61459 RepID=A0ABQ9NJE3_9PEZI|nr:hypothetical protein H2201_008310 [Coniosporium apollinis]
MAATVAEQVALKEAKPDEYISLHSPSRMGNAGIIAYGGCTMGTAVNAACQSAQAHYYLYSALGYYLGPSLTDRKVFCTVHRVRDTRTFATRRVEVSQRQDDGTKRPCFVLLADFQVKEPPLLRFSASPSRQYPDVDDCPTWDLIRETLVSEHGFTKRRVDAHKAVFDLMGRFWDQRQCPEGVFAQNLMGIAKEIRTTQDDLSITEKASADWLRSKHPLITKAEQLSALAFLMDCALSFVPLAHSHQFLEDAGACSSLDFALRVFVSDLDLNDWHLREMKTVTGDEGRTYSESRLWDRKGRMVASMTQQSILRLPKGVKATL